MKHVSKIDGNTVQTSQNFLSEPLFLPFISLWFRDIPLKVCYLGIFHEKGSFANSIIREKGILPNSMDDRGVTLLMNCTHRGLEQEQSSGVNQTLMKLLFT